MRIALIGLLLMAIGGLIHFNDSLLPSVQKKSLPADGGSAPKAGPSQAEVEELADTALNAPEEPTGNQAAVWLMEEAPDHPLTRQTLLGVLEKDNRMGLKPRIIEFLSERNALIPRSELERSLKSSNHFERAAVIQTLSRFCPADRYQTLESVMKEEKDRHVLWVAVRELARLGEPRSIEVLEAALKSDRLEKQLRSQAKNTLEWLKQGQGVNQPCAGKAQ